MEKMKFLEKYDVSASSQSEGELNRKIKSKPKSIFEEFDCSRELPGTGSSTQSLPKVLNHRHSSDSSVDCFPALPKLLRDIPDHSEERCEESESENERTEELDNERTVLPEQNIKGPSFFELNKMCRETRALVKKNVNRRVELLADDVKFLIQMVQRSSIVETLENIQPLKLPLNSEEEIRDFNEKLANSVEFFKDAYATLLCIGGKDVVDYIRRLLAKVISHDVSLLYNWSGRGKKSFSEMKNILRLFLVCLRKNPLTKNSTEADIASVTKSWLRTAADRMGGRSRRMRRE